MRVAFVYGARPNFVKVAPIVDALGPTGTEVVLIHTGQHYDDALSGAMMRDLGLGDPDHELGVGSGPRAVQVAETVARLDPLLGDLDPDVVVVVGDVNATLAGALAATGRRTPLAHVEAGLRSGDRRMPEELNRLVTDQLSDVLFAPSADAVDHLRAEGRPSGAIHLVGNVMVDSLLAHLDRARARPVLAELGLTPRAYGLVTLHRPENVDDPARLGGLVGALARLAVDLPLVFPAHPRVRAALGPDGVPPGIALLEPLGYLDFLALEADAAVALTDSGGVQEETTVLGVPCVTLRDSTERPVTVTHGTNVVVGTDADTVVQAATVALRAPPRPGRPPRWDGHAAERIVEVLLAPS